MPDSDSVPALPKICDPKTAPWPTFKLSPTERQAISSGKLQHEKLGTTGKLLPGLGSQVTVNIPSAIPPSSIRVPPTPSSVKPGTQNVQGSLGVPVRSLSSNPASSTSPQGARYSAPPTTGIPSTPIRSTGSGSSSQSLAPQIVPSRPVPVKRSTLGVLSFTGAAISLALLISAFAFTAIIPWASWTILAVAALAFILGISGVKSQSASTVSRNLAKWGIFLAAASELIEAARLLFHF
jgi:hypothetical protein